MHKGTVFVHKYTDTLCNICALTTELQFTINTKVMWTERSLLKIQAQAFYSGNRSHQRLHSTTDHLAKKGSKGILTNLITCPHGICCSLLGIWPS